MKGGSLHLDEKGLFSDPNHTHFVSRNLESLLGLVFEVVNSKGARSVRNI